MAPRTNNLDASDRVRVFQALAPYFGKVLPAAFFQKTSQFLPGIERVHNLIEGIYKPAGSIYPLSIASMLKSRYRDQIHYNPDRTWWIHYSPKAGGMNIAVNSGLIRCKAEGLPVLVLHQVSDKSNNRGAQHRLLGLGFVEDFDPKNDLFRIRGLEWGEVSGVLGLQNDDQLLETAIRLEALEKWQPFAPEDRAIYKVSAQRRDAAFSGVVLDNYGFTCAVSGQRFHSRNHIEAQGAHIIGKKVRGTDDPRNGIALSRSIHWAFDAGIFTISDQYEVVINPKARHAKIDAFPLMELDRRRILLPEDEYYRPHPEALEWHKKEIFDRFKL